MVKKETRKNRKIYIVNDGGSRKNKEREKTEDRRKEIQQVI